MVLSYDESLYHNKHVYNNWTADVNYILDQIRINSIVLSNQHKKSYFALASKLKWFRIPMILLSTVVSVFNVGLPTYVKQITVNQICSIISLFVGFIGSLELFLAIGTRMENELVQSKELYLLAIEIQKTLLLEIANRNGDGIAYLEDKFNTYSKLIENSQLLDSKVVDMLTPIEETQIRRVLPNIDIKSDSSNTNSNQPSPFNSLFQYILKSNQSNPIQYWLTDELLKTEKLVKHSQYISSFLNKESRTNSKDTSKCKPLRASSPLHPSTPFMSILQNEIIMEEDKGHAESVSVHDQESSISQKECPLRDDRKSAYSDASEEIIQSEDLEKGIQVRPLSDMDIHSMFRDDTLNSLYIPPEVYGLRNRSFLFDTSSTFGHVVNVDTSENNFDAVISITNKEQKTI